MFELMNNRYLNSLDPFYAMHDFFEAPALSGFRTDLTDEGDHFLLQADLPGFDKKDIQLSIQDNMLNIRAERHSKYEQKDAQDKVIRMERSYGSCSRSFDLTNIDADHISAKYEDGVLKLNLPKQQQTLPEARTLQIE